MLDAGSINIAYVLAVDALVLGDNDLASLVGDIKTRNLTAQALGNKCHLRTIFTQFEIVENKEVFQDLLRRHADCLEQDRNRHLATTINAEEQNVLRIEFVIQP